MTRSNFKRDKELDSYKLIPDFKEKKQRDTTVRTLTMPQDCTPFIKFFRRQVRPHLIGEINPDCLWVSFVYGLPQDPSAMTRKIANVCSSIIPGTRMSSLRWRHLLITLAYYDQYKAGCADQRSFLNILASIQNHDVHTLLKYIYYNDADMNKEASRVINQINNDFIAPESTTLATYARTLFPLQRAIAQDIPLDEEDIIMADLEEQPIILSDNYKAIKVLDKKVRGHKLLYKSSGRTENLLGNQLVNSRT